MKKLGIVVFTIVLVSLLLSSCTSPAQTTPSGPSTSSPPPASPTQPQTPTQTSTGQVYTLTFAWNDVWGPLPRSSQIYRPGGEFQRILYEKSKGRIQLKIIPKMFDAMDILGAVGRGQADMGDIPGPWHTGTVPLFGWEDIPGILDTDIATGLAEGLAVFEDPRVQAIYDETLRPMGSIFLFPAQYGSVGLASKTKVTRVEDFKGLKVRTPSVLTSETIKALGGSPISVAYAEMAVSLKTGVVDSALTTGVYGMQLGLFDVARYYLDTAISPGWTELTIMNAKKYDALPPDLQQAIRDASREAGRMTMLAIAGENITGLGMVELTGVQVSRFSVEEQQRVNELLKPVEGIWLKDAGPRGNDLLAAVKDVVAKYRAFKVQP